MTETDRDPISFETEQTELDLREVVAETIETLRGAASWKGVDLLYVMPASVPAHRRGDPARIEQVLAALLRNAIDLTDHGHIVLRVSVCDAAPGCLRFDVEDSADDVPARLLADRMDAFTQDEEGPSRSPESRLSVDLVVACQLVRLLGGKTGVRVRPGRGSTFSCSMPLAVCAAPPLSPDTKRPPPPRDSMAPPAEVRPGLRVLLVEDNFINREVAVRMLEMLSSDVHIAADGAQALTALKEERFDLVLMDCRMPGMDGLEATRRFRRRELELDLPRTPVLALTANALPEDRGRCLAAGMDDFLAKPFRLRDLRAAIARRLVAEEGRPPGSRRPARRDAQASRRHRLEERPGGPFPPCPMLAPMLPTSPHEPGGRARVLIVDDDELMRLVMEATLSAVADVETCDSGEAALEVLAESDFDLVCADNEMPGMSGVELLHRLGRERPATGRVLVTGLSAEQLPGGARDHRVLHKPFDPDSLVRMVLSVTGTAGGPT